MWLWLSDKFKFNTFANHLDVIKVASHLSAANVLFVQIKIKLTSLVKVHPFCLFFFLSNAVFFNGTVDNWFIQVSSGMIGSWLTVLSSPLYRVVRFSTSEGSATPPCNHTRRQTPLSSPHSPLPPPTPRRLKHLAGRGGAPPEAPPRQRPRHPSALCVSLH